MSRGVVGPSLPPHLQGMREEEENEDEEGPRLPREPCLGPSLPPGPEVQEEGDTSSDDSDYGPALPPGLQTRLAPPAHHSEEEESEDDSATIGPRLQEKSHGPASGLEAALEIEARAKRMRDKLEGKDEQIVKRETWMLELPEEKANTFGLGPRSFSRKGLAEKGKDRSKWTDSPEEKARKLALGIGEHTEEEPKEEEDFASKVNNQRDEAMAAAAEELRLKRGTDSLMDIHDKKLKKKKKEDVDDGLVKERRPFDRDLDLQANQFDAAAKKAMLKKAAKINDRFSSGSQKFL